MEHYYPSYYRDFHCIAAACPDSCCQGWDVVIDSDTEAFYSAVPGAFGDRLREAIYTDSDGDRVFRLADEKKCPFWGGDRLCEIYRTLGEEHLCVTCARFPRLTMDYTAFVEHSLALACPEAARLILHTDGAYAAFADSAAAYEEDDDLIRFLLNERQKAAGILTSEKPLALRFDELLTAAVQMQTALTGDTIQQSSPEQAFGELEYIDEHNRGAFIQAAETVPDLSQNERELTHLALYYLYRYFLGAVDTLDVLSPVRFLITSVGVIANLAQNCGLIATAQLYSKEVEQSYENMERML